MPDKYIRDVAEVFDDEGHEVSSITISGAATTEIVAAKAGKRIKVIAGSFASTPPAGNDNDVAYLVGASSTKHFKMGCPDSIPASIFHNFGPSGWVLTANTKLSVVSNRAGSSADATVVYKYID